jgi:tetratricopeptide (TPR) repeat protein
LHAARQGKPEGAELLAELVRRPDAPDIARATAIELLQSYPTPKSDRLRRDALADPNALVRAAAVRSFAADSTARLVKEIGPRLEDSVRSVRLAAANRLVADAEALADSDFRQALDDAVKDYRAAQVIHLDRAQASRNLGMLSVQMGDLTAAVESLRTAIRLEPYLTGPRTELSQLLDQMLSDPAYAEAARQVGATSEVVRRLREEEVENLVRDAKLLPNDAFPHFQRGRLLYLLGREDDAREAFAQATRVAPNEYEYWMWLALICERQQRWEEAVAALKEMQRLRPEADEWKGIGIRIRETILAQQETDAAADAATPAGESLEQRPAKAIPAEPPSAPSPKPPTTPGQKQLPAAQGSLDR